MSTADNFQRIRDLLADDPGSFVPAPARMVGELILTCGVTAWRDPETGVDKIDSFSIQSPGHSIIISGPRMVCAYEPEDTVLVAVH